MFDKDYFEERSYNREERVSLTIRTMEQIEKYINVQKDKALVIGCAFGYEVEGLYKYGFKEVYGLDISEYAINEAKKIYPQWKDKFVIGDIHNIPFGAEEFSFIFAADVLEHTYNPVQALKEIYRVLRKGGCVYMRVPNTFAIQIYYLFPFKRIWRFIMGYDYILDDPTHYSELPAYRWEYFFKIVGFKFIRLKIEDWYIRGSKKILGKPIVFKKPFLLQLNLHYLLIKL